MSNVRRLFKPRILTKVGQPNQNDIGFKRKWKRKKHWQDQFVDPSMFKIPKPYDARGLIGYWDDDKNEKQFMYDWKSGKHSITSILNKNEFLQDARYAYPLLSSLGYDIKHTCYECKDTGLRPACDCGQGEFVCEHCNDGGFNCEECDDGYIGCDDCDGNGRNDCDNCDEGTIPCEHCDADGKIECVLCEPNGCIPCKGTGLITLEGAIIPNSLNTLYCEDCLGSGTKACNSPECDEGIRNCNNCGGDGEQGCNECDGDGYFDCDYCDDGWLTCEQCDDGWVTCGECDGNAHWVCPGCDGDWAGGECESFAIPHRQDKNWIIQNTNRRNALLNSNNAISNKISINFIKHIIFESYDYHKLFSPPSYGTSKKDTPYAEELKKLIRKNKETDKYDKLSEPQLLKLEKQFNKITDKQGYGISSKVIVHNIPYISPKTGNLNRYAVSKYNANFLIHHSWDEYLSYLKIRVRKFPKNATINLVKYNYESYTFVYIADELHYTRSGFRLNPSGTLLVVPSNNFTDWKSKAISENLVKKSFMNHQPYPLKQLYRKPPFNETTYQGMIDYITVNKGAAAKTDKDWSQFQMNRWFQGKIILLKGLNSKKKNELHSLYYDMDNEKLSHPAGGYLKPSFPIGFPHSVSARSVTMFTTDLKFQDYSFMNWLTDNPLDNLKK